jgi:hypothetical protein
MMSLDRGPGAQLRYSYSVYGVTLRSAFELSLPEFSQPGMAEIEIVEGPSAMFREAIEGIPLQQRSDWYHYAHLQDGSSYVVWSGLGEFLVSASGGRVTCGRDPGATKESFQVYLLGQALSWALVKSGFEPLHATAIAVNGESFAMVGSSGFGKSSLAACFLAAGHRLLTDDLLLTRQRGSGFDAYPGPARIKLFPAAAQLFLPHVSGGVPMNGFTDKLVIPIENHYNSCLPLRAIYSLAGNDEVGHPRIEALSLRSAFLTLVGGTFNYMVVDPERLRRQAGETMQIVSRVPVSKLSYPWGLDRLDLVREAIVDDFSHNAEL